MTSQTAVLQHSHLLDTIMCPSQQSHCQEPWCDGDQMPPCLSTVSHSGVKSYEGDTATNYIIPGAAAPNVRFTKALTEPRTSRPKKLKSISDLVPSTKGTERRPKKRACHEEGVKLHDKKSNRSKILIPGLVNRQHPFKATGTKIS